MIPRFRGQCQGGARGLVPNGAGGCVPFGTRGMPRPTGAAQAVHSNGPMYLRHGLRRPNFRTKFGASVRSSCRAGEFSSGVCTLWKTSFGKGADRLLTGREKDAILKVYRRGWVWQPGAAGGNARRYAPLAAKECGCVQIQVEPRIVSIRPELFGSGRFSMLRWGKEGRCGDFSGSGRAFWLSPSA